MMAGLMFPARRDVLPCAVSVRAADTTDLPLDGKRRPE